LAEKFLVNQLIDNLFRHESGKLVSILTRIFGSENLALAEDVVQDSLLEATDQWAYKGIPDNPAGWLFKVAKNKALNIVNREKYKRGYSSGVVHHLQSERTAKPALDHFFSEEEILDDQLRMIFTCCHPAISTDSQIALALKTLCGFSIPEIAKAFLSTEENINKRLVRARQKIREDKIPFEVPEGNNLEKRLQSVLETIYLLFNEGYSASKGNDIVRHELCSEAIRLAEIIAAHKTIHDKSNLFALLSLMLLNASRFKARQDSKGNLLTMPEQDRSLWDKKMMEAGFEYLNKSVQGEGLSIYHVLAAISAHHCIAPDYQSTDWQSILSLYDNLVQIDNSPLVLLNRAIAVSKVSDAKKALQALEQIKNNPSLRSYHLFYSTQAELFIQINQYAKAARRLEKAIELAPLQAEKDVLQKKLNSLRKNIS
jgi:RNA polymerase sigma factor (sigma-70 family)